MFLKENFGPQFHPAVVNKSKSNKQSGNGSNNKRPRSRSPSPIGRSSSSSKSSSSSFTKSKNSSNKYRIESDEEYDDDSDMDDFIDDSEANPSQISAMIGQMFGYDRRKFRYVSFSRIFFFNFFREIKTFVLNLGTRTILMTDPWKITNFLP